MTRCLLVDDDPAIRDLLVDYLRPFGMFVESLQDGAGLRRRLPMAGIDVLLLDLMLPDESGLALCQWVKQSSPALPVIMLTAQGDPLSRVLGLELGADDYLPKPFEPRELVARIKAVLRRSPGTQMANALSMARFAGWVFDRLRRELTGPDGAVVSLSAAEFRLLSAFVDHPQRVLGRERLLELTVGSASDVSDRSVDLAVSRLRGKLGDSSPQRPIIRTLRGQGYMFDVKVTP
jgi:two-component system, OmpR family, response regulator